jgi:hypothetical protein
LGPRRLAVKNEAGVACIPESCAAFRLKAFETWPGALIGPVRGKILCEIRLEQEADLSGTGSLVQVRMAARQRMRSTRRDVPQRQMRA